jgi:hypothetical protein
MIKWVDIDESKYSRPVKEGRPGLPPIERAVSAYEIPCRVGVAHDPERPTEIIVLFDYLSTESVSDKKVSESLSVGLGMHSGRLRRAVVDLAPLLNSGPKPAPEKLGEYIAAQVVGYLRSDVHRGEKSRVRSDVAGQVVSDNHRAFSSLLVAPHHGNWRVENR